MLSPNDPLIEAFSNFSGIAPTTVLIIFTVVFIWDLVWKGLGMWMASKKNSPTWFIVMLVINSIGILPILYIYVFSEMGKKNLKNRNLRRKR